MKRVIHKGECDYQILLQQSEHEGLLILNYLVTVNGTSFFMYQLGIDHSRTTRSHFDWIPELSEIGFSFVEEMIAESDFTIQSGLIAYGQQLDLDKLNWRMLPEVGR